MNRDTNFKI